MTPGALAPLLQDGLVASAQRDPDKVALVCGEARLTYRALDERSDALAVTLLAHGLAAGDRVAIFCGNTVEAVIGFWAALKAGGVAVVLSHELKRDKLAFILADCTPTAVLGGECLAPDTTLPEAATTSLRLLVRCAPAAPTLGSARVVPFAEASAAEGRSLLARPRTIDADLACLIYTSGSTGEPKAVMLTHANMRAAARSIASCLGHDRDDVILNVLPLSFDYGLYQMIMAFRAGARLVLEPSFAYPAEVLARVAAERVTTFPGVPTIFALLADLQGLDRHDLGSVVRVTNTAAALGGRQLEELGRIFPRARIFSMYGLTECKRVSILPPAELERRRDSVGLPLPNTEVWVVDDEGRRLPPGHTGQLVVRGATVMRGYWRRPRETAERLRPGPLPGERVLYTGDLARLDEDGFLYFVGRMDDVIKSRGLKVAPLEVEKALTSVPGVREAAVIGVPDPILGHAIKAFVVPAAGQCLEARRLRRECQRRLESHLVPHEIVIVDRLDKSANGKIRKTELPR